MWRCNVMRVVARRLLDPEDKDTMSLETSENDRLYRVTSQKTRIFAYTLSLLSLLLERVAFHFELRDRAHAAYCRLNHWFSYCCKRNINGKLTIVDWYATLI